MSRNLQIRDYDPEIPGEENFLFDSWMKSFKTSRTTGPIPANMYWDTYRAVITQLLSRWGVRVVMAYDPTDTPPDDLYGYAVIEEGFDRPVVHYAYVKDQYRHKGVLKYLLKKAGIDGTYWFTFKTADSTYLKEGLWRDEIAKKKKPEPLPGSIWHTKPIQKYEADPRRQARRLRDKEKRKK